MKLCQSCQQRPAVVEFIQVMGNVRREISLCRECAITQGMQAQIEAFQQISQQLLEQLQGQEEEHPATPRPIVLPCPTCGLTFEEFVRTGLLGCPKCYVEFAPVLTPILRRMHGVAHMPKSEEKPHHAELSTDTDVAETGSAEKDELELKIELALLEENYELAAQLRDQLKKLL